MTQMGYGAGKALRRPVFHQPYEDRLQEVKGRDCGSQSQSQELTQLPSPGKT